MPMVVADVPGGDLHSNECIFSVVGEIVCNQCVCVCVLSFSPIKHLYLMSDFILNTDGMFHKDFTLL